MADFLSKRARRLTVVDQPIRSDPDVSPIASYYSNGKLVRKTTFPTPRFLTAPGRGDFRKYWIMIIDVLAALGYAVLSARKIDVFIGVDVLNAAIGWALKKLGVVAIAVYVVTDFSKRRSGSPLSNWVSRELDRSLVRRCDVVLNTTEEDKRRRGVPVSAGAMETNLPSLCPPVLKENYTAREEPVVGYLGALEKRFGVDIAISSMPEILSKTPDARMVIVGSGFERERLESLVRELGLEKMVRFYGFLPDAQAVEVMSTVKVGFAPYVVNPELGMLHDLDSAKVRFYAWCGVPSVASTDTPQVVSLVEKFSAGVSSNPNPMSLARSALQLLQDESLYQRTLEGCRNLAKSFDSESYFEDLFPRITALLPKA
jgi:glycosyltransferase involved in cell wall biosynthesis